MDYKSIVCFLRVCELHSFTKAAEDLYISQPALSRRILALEDELGVKLLDRANGGLQLTEGGKLFYSDAKKLINVEAALKQKMEKHRDGFYGEVRIGYSSYCFMEPLMHAAHMLGETYPNIEPDFQSMSPRYAIYSFLHGQIDIAYLCRGDIPQTNDSVIEVIAKAQSVILIPKGHKLWDRQYVTCSDLVGERFAISKTKSQVSDSIRESFEAKGVFLENALQCESANTRIFQIATGRYIGMDGVYSSKYFDYYADFIRAIPCADMDFNFADYCAVYHPSNGNAERFVNCMIENSEKQK